MANLLKLELKRLFGRLVCDVMVLLCPVLGVLIGMMNHSSNNPVTDGMFEWCTMLCVLLSALGGIFISREFTQNTIRNKIIVGHSRINIYLSKLVAVAVLYLVCVSLFVVSVSITAWMLTGNMNVQEQSLVLMYFSSMVCVALTTAISMTLRSDLGGLVPLILLYLSIIFGGLGYELIDKEIMDCINLFLPCGQMMEAPKNLPLNILCYTAEILLVSVAGFTAFREADLN